MGRGEGALQSASERQVTSLPLQPIKYPIKHLLCRKGLRTFRLSVLGAIHDFIKKKRRKVKDFNGK